MSRKPTKREISRLYRDMESPWWKRAAQRYPQPAPDDTTPVAPVRDAILRATLVPVALTARQRDAINALFARGTRTRDTLRPVWPSLVINTVDNDSALYREALTLAKLKSAKIAHWQDFIVAKVAPAAIKLRDANLKVPYSDTLVVAAIALRKWYTRKAAEITD